MLLIAQLCEEKTKVVVKLVMKFAGEILYACPGSKTLAYYFQNSHAGNGKSR